MKRLFKRILLSLFVASLLFLPLADAGDPWVSKPPVGSTIDWGHPLSKGLVVSTIFNENGGLIYKNLANQNKSGSSVGATYNPVWKPDKYGSSLYFDGTNDVVNLGDYPDIGGVGVTISIVALVKFSDVLRAAKDTIIAKRNGQLTDCNFAFRRGRITNGFPNLEFYHYNGAWRIWYDDTTLENNKNYLVAVTYDGLTPPKFYVDGKLGTSVGDAGYGSVTSLVSNNYNCYIGGVDYTQATTTNNEPFLGNISSVFVWSNRVLSKQEIQSLYQSPYQFIKSPQSWYVSAVAAVRRMFITS